jgi:hypothetical protein
MYRIIGGDSKQYGPVSADEMREWIRLGRAAASTLAQRVGEAEWIPLANMPEFADDFAGAAGTSNGDQGPVAPGADPGFTPLPGATAASGAWGGPALDAPPDPDQLAAEAIARSPGLDIGRALGRGWELLTADFWAVVGVTALNLLVLACANSVMVGIVVAGPIFGGLQWYLLKRVRGEQALLSDSFAGFTTGFLQLMLGYIVISLLGTLGLILCLLPGIYLLVAWQFALLLTIEKKMDFWPAMEVSRKVITREWWSFFAFAIVGWLLNLVGALCCVVGFFVTMPWTLLAMVCLYEDRFGPVKTERPALSPG